MANRANREMPGAVSIFFGLLLIYVSIFHWRKLQEKPGDRKGRVPDTFKGDWRKW
ncbi:MAG: hypothetical protein ABIH76_01570 [Candidatus Bathyarchaeota archaeon]